ncbi:MAG: hypothetical protein PW843_17520 [Azospirillaceae bacterium]|nr:hypothetical protein [Azospirillaceae bacterium]
MGIGCLLLAGAVVIGLGACSPRQLYATGQAWRKSTCRDYPPAERSRCEAEADRPYADYRRETVEGRGQ